MYKFDRRCRLGAAGNIAVVNIKIMSAEVIYDVIITHYDLTATNICRMEFLKMK